MTNSLHLTFKSRFELLGNIFDFSDSFERRFQVGFGRVDLAEKRVAFAETVVQKVFLLWILANRINWFSKFSIQEKKEEK